MYRFSITGSVEDENTLKAKTLEEYTFLLRQEIYKNQQIISTERNVYGYIFLGGLLFFYLQMPLSAAGVIFAMVTTFVAWIFLEVIRRVHEGQSGTIALLRARKEKKIYIAELGRTNTADARIKPEPA